MKYENYPIVMTHPGFRRSERIPIPGTERPINGVMTPDYRGTAELLPPVTAVDEGMEEYYKSQGYELAGKGDPAAYAMAQSTTVDPEYVPQEYPKWHNGKLINSKEEETSESVEQPAETTGHGDTATAGGGVAEVTAPTDQAAEIEALKAQIAALTAAGPAAYDALLPRKPTPSDRAKKAWETRRAKANA